MFIGTMLHRLRRSGHARKKIRIEGQLSGHEKEIRELENNMKHLRFSNLFSIWYDLGMVSDDDS